MTRSVFPHWGGLARPFRALRFVIARYIRTRPKVSVTSLELGAIVIVLLWIGVVAKHLGDRSADFLSTRSSMNNFALFFEESVLRSIGEIDKALLYLRKSIVARNGSGDYARLVDSTDLLSDVIVQVAIFDEAGSLLASSGDHRPTYSIGLNDQEYFRYRVNGSDDELFIGRPSIERGSGRLTVPFARQFRKADGGLGGVVVASFDPMHFESLFSGMDLGVGATYLLVGDDGVVRGAPSGRVTALVCRCRWRSCQRIRKARLRLEAGMRGQGRALAISSSFARSAATRSASSRAPPRRQSTRIP